MRLSILPVLIALTTTLASSYAGTPPAHAALDAAPTFTQVRVQSAVLSGEPQLHVDATNGNIYVATPESSTQLYRSTDGGVTYQRVARTAGGSGDSDVVTDLDGVVYASDLLGAGGLLVSTIPVSVSLDHGATFARIHELDPSAGGIDFDRQWMAAHAHGHVVVSARAGSVVDAWRSLDAGVTWSGPVTVASDVNIAGEMVFAPDGTLWQPYWSGSDMKLAKSTNEGASWTSVTVGAVSGSILFPAMDVDAAGNLYVAWSRPNGITTLFGLATVSAGVYATRSVDGGATWSAFQQVSDAGRTAVFPWVAAGTAGKVNVAFFEASESTDPDLGTPLTRWDVVNAQSLDAANAVPTWTRSVAVTGFHVGSVCTSGLLCLGPQNLGLVNAPTPFDRRDLDFIGMDTDAAGNLHVAYMKDRPVTSGNLNDVVFSQTDLFVARQTGGSTV